jgi:hypothetical protein
LAFLQIDFRDQDFSRAVSLIAAAGKNLPAETAAQIASTFRGNLPALKTLKAVYSTQGLPTEPIDDMIKPLDGLGLDDSEAVTEFLGYSTSPMAHKNEWRTSSLEGMLNKYERGFNVDCSVSPYRQDVQSIIDDPTKPASVQEAKIGGLGILMVKRTMDDFVYLRDDGTNVVVFKKGW